MGVDLSTVLVFSYGSGAVMFLVLTLLLLTAWRGRLQGALLVLASALSLAWCATLAGAVAYDLPTTPTCNLLEIARNAGWYLFLLGLLGWRALFRFGLLISLVICGVAAFQVLVQVPSPDALGPEGRFTAIAFLAMAVGGLVWVEQLYRNTREEHRWAIKPLCVGIGGLFAYDFFIYASAALLGTLDEGSVAARGVVNAVAVPFIALAAARNRQWSLEIFVSRQVVFHSAAFLGSGVYLLGMAATGYYVKVAGGTWGTVAQIVFFCAAVLLLISLMFSGAFRARAKVFLSKHFFRNKYDYREEWLRFTHTLSTSQTDGELRQNIVRGIAQIVFSRGGALWARTASGDFGPRAEWNLTIPGDANLPKAHPLLEFLARREWVIVMDEYAREPQKYPDIVLPDCLSQIPEAWIIVPLKERDELFGLILLTGSLSRRPPDWEDCDLLKTVGRQAASYLALMEATDALASSRQFEAFNRLSAFVVHDLKNVAAQLALVTTNARRHIQDPDFVADAMSTVENATAKMNRMLAQLRKERSEDTSSRLVNVGTVLKKVLKARSGDRPVPRLGTVDPGAIIAADPERLSAIVEHLVQNAQEATADSGTVELRARREAGRVAIEVEDSGTGMAPDFVANRLFRPFDTTKGNAGMGIGVYESREFARANGGNLEVQSLTGRGSTFTLWFPADRERIPDLPQLQEVVN